MVPVRCRSNLVLLVCLLSASLGTGCRRSDEMTFDVLDGVKYRILVQAGAPSFTSSKTTGDSGQEIFRWDNGNLKIELRVTRPKAAADSFSSRLKIGESDYGTLKPGDDVIIDARQAVKVTVNGVERTP